MRKPVVIAETSAVRTHFDESCFQFFASDDPADLARALRALYHNPDRALEMIESASRRYRFYSWDAQRHVYCQAALGGVAQHARGRIAAQEHIAHISPVVETTLALSPIDLTGMVTPIEEEAI